AGSVSTRLGCWAADPPSRRRWAWRSRPGRARRAPRWCPVRCGPVWGGGAWGGPVWGGGARSGSSQLPGGGFLVGGLVVPLGGLELLDLVGQALDRLVDDPGELAGLLAGHAAQRLRELL